MRKELVGGLALSVLGLLLRSAEAATMENFTVGNWLAGAYSDDKTGAFSHCAMSASYQSGIYMAFSIGPDFQWSLGFGDAQWKLAPSSTYALRLFIDGRGPIAATAYAVNTQIVQVPMQDNAALFEQLRRGYQLRVNAVGQDFFFDLNGTSRGLSAVLSCTQRYVVANQPAVTTNPFVAQSQGTAPSANRSAIRAEATTLTANLLSQSGISGFQIVEPQKVPKEWQNYDVVWTAPGLVGTVLVLLPGPHQQPNELRASLIASDAQSCKGRFASGSIPDANAAQTPSFQLFTACANGQADNTAYYLGLLRPAGGSYVFGVAGTGAANENVRAAENGIRDAALRLSH